MRVLDAGIEIDPIHALRHVTPHRVKAFSNVSCSQVGARKQRDVTHANASYFEPGFIQTQTRLLYTLYLKGTVVINFAASVAQLVERSV